MITSSELKKMSNVKISEVDKTKLVDIKSIIIDTDLPIKERLENFIEKIKNPYCYLCDDIVVKIEFSDTGKSLDDLLKKYLINLKNR